MAKSFENVLREQCQARGGPRAKRVLRVLDRKFLPGRRAKLLRKWEAEARDHLAANGLKVGADWGSVKERDWDAFFDKLLEFLLAILPIIMQFF